MTLINRYIIHIPFINNINNILYILVKIIVLLKFCYYITMLTIHLHAFSIGHLKNYV